MGSVDGKVALITGGANGMGASHVHKLLEEGAKVAFTDFNEKAGNALLVDLQAEFSEGQVLFIPQDVADPASWLKVVEKVEETFGPIDILVNNAGVNHSDNIEDFPVDAYERVIAVNQTAVFLAMKAVIPSMKKAGQGSIINISSIGGIRGRLQSVAYSASKFAVTGMTKVAALELGQYNIRANSIHPSLVNTDMFHEDPNSASTASDRPLGRVLTKDEVSNLVLFLASDESSYMTGSENVIDGGLTAR